MEIGTEVTVDTILVRKAQLTALPSWRYESRYYEEESLKEPMQMFYIGWRMGSSGEVYHGHEEGDTYTPDTPVRYALMVKNDRSNPVKIPWRIIEATGL